YVADLTVAELAGAQLTVADLSVTNLSSTRFLFSLVVILSVRATLVRNFMIAAFGLGMTKGDWVFVALEMNNESYWEDSVWSVDNKNDSVTRKAYEALIRVSLLLPTKVRFQDVADKDKKKTQTDYNYIISERKKVDFAIGAFYDGIYLLGMALNETISMGGNIRDGLTITKLMWGREFNGITGHVKFDDKGDRDADYSILDLNPITGSFEVVAHYSGLNKTYLLVPGQMIHWPEGRKDPPLDIPKCGFLNDHPKCMNDESAINIIYGIVALGLILAFSASLAFVYFKRVRRVPENLNNMSWHIRPNEVIFDLDIFYDSELGLLRLPESINSLHTSSNIITEGIYRGTRVCIKKITKKKMDINKKLLWEIKQVKDVIHENAVCLLGACIESPTVLIITEYCTMGSLREVLRNDEISLDWNIKMLLIDHIAKGMSYLHNSEISAHGKLNSHNCLIDGHFVLKICDFGLTSLMTPDDIIKDISYYMKLLWVAPELLPNTVIVGTPATQKGDVYSFAIILEEIILRAGPFFAAMQCVDVHEILKRVVARATPPFRPTVDDTNCSDGLIYLMESCWEDNPNHRPTFDVIRGAFRSIMKNYYGNMMETHQTQGTL
ncbi:PREDICTED: atrial natriuretic peptide receptor 1-like, partial [Nicrophorus vespilloides]|uniref:guanylate cyclase n=1 Tax=Nicrophorus vespilloides TaxID=110193 RepID=A0ABM1MU40_NICVS